MQLDSARPMRRALTIAVAAALLAAALPARAAQRAMPAAALRAARTVVAVDDAYSVATGGSLQIVAPGVASNDAIRGGLQPITLVKGPSHGALRLAADGGFAYTPVRGFSGVDTFRYAITEGAARGEANVAIHVVSEVDVAVTASAFPTHVAPGAPTTLTFKLVNLGPGDADAVKLEVLVPVRPGAVHPDTRCTMTIERGRWACPMGSLATGGVAQASFTVVANGPQLVEAKGMAFADKDLDTSNNNTSVAVEVGRLALKPAHLVARTTWSPARKPGAEVVQEAAVLNQTRSAVAYHIQPQDTSAAPPPWLAVTPDSGSIDARGVRHAKVILSPGALAPGLHRARLHISHDSPFAIDDAPVSFTVAFIDVKEDRLDDPYIHALAGAGVTAGCANGEFCPEKSLSRAGAAVWLLLSGEGSAYQPPPAQGIFGDLASDRPEAPFVEELVRRGVMGGCATNPAYFFCPDKALARAEATVVVLRMLEGPDYTPPVVAPRFIDTRRDPRAMFIEEAARRGLFTSCAAGREMFCPQDGLTRGDAAVALVKAFNLPLF